MLYVVGKKVVEDGECIYLYCGIVNWLFKCWFDLVDYVCVIGVIYENGMLYIDLVCEVFEVLKLCWIEIVCSVVSLVDLVEVKLVN